MSELEPPLLVTPGLVVRNGETKSLLSGEVIKYPLITVQSGGVLRNKDDNPDTNPIIESDIQYSGTLGHIEGVPCTITVVGTITDLGGGTRIGEFTCPTQAVVKTSSSGGVTTYDPAIFERYGIALNDADVEDFIDKLVKDRLGSVFDIPEEENIIDLRNVELEDIPEEDRIIDLKNVELEDASNYIINVQQLIQEKNNDEVGVKEQIVVLANEERYLQKRIYDLSKMGMIDNQLKNMRESLNSIKEERQKLEQVLYKIRKERQKMMDIYEKMNKNMNKNKFEQRKQMEGVMKAIKRNNIILFIIGAVVVGYIVYSIFKDRKL